MSILVGLVLGGGVVFLFFWTKQRSQKAAQQELDAIVEKLKGAVADVSMDVLTKTRDPLLSVAQQKLSAIAALGEKDLAGKKDVIVEVLAVMKQEMEKVESLMRSLEKDRENKFSELTTSLKSAAEQTQRLQHATDQLNSVLSNTKQRGHLGERITEDILRLVGFVQNINYTKQETQGEGRPDYTFLLPRNLKINMDVKFPLNNYKRFLECSSPLERETYKKQFLVDARLRVKEVTSKDYIDPEHGTVNYAILFIPSEQGFAFIQESDPVIFEEALKQRVICCSPLTLYAVLVTLRQAIDIFVIGQRTQGILECLSSFNKNWGKFIESFDDLGKKIDAVKKEYEALTTTRRNKLDSSLRHIQDMRQDAGLPLEDTSDAPDS